MLPQGETQARLWDENTEWQVTVGSVICNISESSPSRLLFCRFSDVCSTRCKSRKGFLKNLHKLIGRASCFLGVFAVTKLGHGWLFNKV
jgi:hypothetical protein